MKPQKAQLAQNSDRDPIDDAIDRVTARLTHVDEDAAFASRVLEALPERRFALTWILAGWAPRLVVLAIAVGTLAVVLRTFDDGSTTVLRTEHATAPIAGPPAAVERTIVEPSLAARRTIVEPSSNVRRTTVAVDRPDHDRSLPAIEAVVALDVDILMPANLPEDAPLTVPPLAIADLPMTADFPPR